MEIHLCSPPALWLAFQWAMQREKIHKNSRNKIWQLELTLVSAANGFKAFSKPDETINWAIVTFKKQDFFQWFKRSFLWVMIARFWCIVFRCSSLYFKVCWLSSPKLSYNQWLTAGWQQPKAQSFKVLKLRVLFCMSLKATVNLNLIL